MRKHSDLFSYKHVLSKLIRVMLNIIAFYFTTFSEVAAAFAYDDEQYQIIFFHPSLETTDCSEEIEMIHTQAFATYVAEMIELTPLSPDIAVKMRPELRYSRSFMNEYASSLDSSHVRKVRKLFQCTLNQCESYKIKLLLDLCGNCRRRLNDHDDTNSFNDVRKNEINGNRKLKEVTGNNATIQKGRGFQAIKLVYDLVKVLPDGECKKILSKMSYKMTDVSYV